MINVGSAVLTLSAGACAGGISAHVRIVGGVDDHKLTPNEDILNARSSSEDSPSAPKYLLSIDIYRTTVGNRFCNLGEGP